MLETILSIRQGDSQAEIKNKLGREPTIVEIDKLPAWLEEAVPAKDTGEYWYYFMGYPPRNLIIYFDQNKTVSYVTWGPNLENQAEPFTCPNLIRRSGQLNVRFIEKGGIQ